MDVADLEFTVGALEVSGGGGIRYRSGGYFKADELSAIVLFPLQPQFPAGRLPALAPGDKEPVSYPIEKQNS